MDKYKVIKTIGQSLYGKIVMASIGDQFVVIKECEKGLFENKRNFKNNPTNDDIYEEIRILKYLKNQYPLYANNKSESNIIDLYETIETPTQHNMIIEYMDFDLYEYYIERKRYRYGSFNETMSILRQICSGLKYIHSLGIIHNDLSLENVLLKKNGSNISVKICDFGLSYSMNSMNSMTSMQNLNESTSKKIGKITELELS